MNNDNVYLYEVRVLTPLIVAEEAGYRGFVYRTISDFLPGSTVRGALLTKLYLEGPSDVKKFIEEEGVNPQTSFSWALKADPRGLELFKTLDIAHPLCQKSKYDGRIYSLGVMKLLDKYRALRGLSPDVASTLKQALSLLLKDSMEHRYKEYLKQKSPAYHPAEYKPISGKPIYYDASSGAWLEVKGFPEDVLVETAINKARRSVACGMLFGYEYIASGSLYVGLAEGELIKRAIQEYGPTVEVSIGRGVSRGFGRCLLSFKELGENFLQLEELSSTDLLVFKAISPSPTSFSELKIGDLTLSLEFVLPASPQVIRGYSVRTNTRKMPLTLPGPGSLYVFKALGNLKDLLHYAHSMLFKGINGLGGLGLGHLQLMVSDPLAGEVP